MRIFTTACSKICSLMNWSNPATRPGTVVWFSYTVITLLKPVPLCGWHLAAGAVWIRSLGNIFCLTQSFCSNVVFGSEGLLMAVSGKWFDAQLLDWDTCLSGIDCTSVCLTVPDVLIFYLLAKTHLSLELQTPLHAYRSIYKNCMPGHWTFVSIPFHS